MKFQDNQDEIINLYTVSLCFRSLNILYRVSLKKPNANICVLLVDLDSIRKIYHSEIFPAVTGTELRPATRGHERNTSIDKMSRW